MLARAITLVESTLPADAALAAQVLDAVRPHAGRSRRVGITGAPGVGKSTFIEALGIYLVRARKERVAVLSVDPSSPISRGSILGDKTRMQRLAAEPDAFIRPSPSGGELGGIARSTGNAVLLCEAAGYRNVLIETVGVGQSESAVREIADFFLLLMLPGAGDELQGIKRGIMEMADCIAVNKADGDNVRNAERTRSVYASALPLMPASAAGWVPRVLCCSSLDSIGIEDIWQTVLDHETAVQASRS